MTKAAVAVLVLAALTFAQEVRGRAVDEAGRPLRGITADPGEDGVPDVETAEDGRFVLPGRSDGGSRQLELRGRGRATVQVWAREDAGDVAMPRGTLLVGRVVDEDGAPIAGATVRSADLMSAGSQEWFPRLRSGPRFRASATSGDDGYFVVEGALAALVLVVVEHQDFLPEMVEAVRPGEPTDIVMQRPRLVPGVVLGIDGEPVAGAHVAVSVPWLRQPIVHSTGDGTFVARVPPGIDATIHATLQVGTDFAMGRARFTADSNEPVRIQVVLRSRPAASGEAPVRLHVRGPGGVSVSGVRALVCSTKLDAERFERDFARATSVEPDAEGLVTLDSAGDFVEITADGCGRLRVPLSGIDGDPIDVELPPPSSIRGRLVDADSQEPLSEIGVAVLRRAEWEEEDLRNRRREGPSFSPSPWVGVRSGVDGYFEVSGLGPGEWMVYPVTRDRPRIEPVPVTLARGASAGDVVVAMPVGATITLRFVDGVLPADIAVRLPAMLPPRSGSSRWDDDQSGAQRPDADGVVIFRFRAVYRHRIELLVPQPLRFGAPRKVAIRAIEVGSGDATLTVSLAKDGPRDVTGVLSIDGPRLPEGRAVVVAEPQPTEQRMMYGYVRFEGAIAPVARDGTFGMRLEPGRFDLLVVDAATRAVLSEPVELVVPRDRSMVEPLELTARVTHVRVSIDGSADVRRDVARIYTDLGEFWPGGVGRISPDPPLSGVNGVGLALPRGQDHSELWLPRCEQTLRANTRTLGGADPGIVGEISIDTTGHERLEVVLPIGR